MNSVEDLDVFKLAHQLALKTYATTKAFPKEELFSLGDQTRRAASRRHSFRRFENSRNVEVPRNGSGTRTEATQGCESRITNTTLPRYDHVFSVFILSPAPLLPETRRIQ